MRLEVRMRGREPEAWLARGGDGAWVTGGVGAVDVCAFGAVEPPGGSGERALLKKAAERRPERALLKKAAEQGRAGVAFLLIDVAGVWRGHAKKSWPWLLEMCPASEPS